MNLHFSGNRALVLGGTCELALLLAYAMIESNLFPILTYRDDKGLSAIQGAVRSFHGRYATCYLNFGDHDSLDSVFTQIGDDLDFLVDFAQGNYESLIAGADEDSIYSYFLENISFRAEVLKRVGRAMLKKRKGRLVYISSAAASKPNPGQGFYAAAKLASEALYRNMGLELGGRGVTTVILRPGYIDAGRGRIYLQKQDRKILEMTPIKRAITGEEITETILFLLSDSAAGINATEISMDGGLTSGK
ncbi:MAG: SDR family NAD(P)-dependent oxidoreductase [Syntrophales bacterium]|jgi:3-oxoacyl-[acyl-carrier protein] reductase